MSYNTKICLNDFRACQKIDDTLTLSGTTSISLDGNIKYVATGATITGATQLTTKEYVDAQAGGSTIYDLTSPSTVTVGGLPAASVLTGKSSNCILKDILTPYQSPAFSSFSSNISTPIEVGTILSGTKEFSWGFSNPTNVSGSTMCIIDITSGNTVVQTNISTTSSAPVNIGTKVFTDCGDIQQWCGSAKNTNGVQFNSGAHTITGLYPYYWGTCTCPGAVGENRPVPNVDFNPSNITGGTKVLADSSSSIGINFNSGDNDYLWFAVPASVADKTSWYVDVNNFGVIGGSVGAGGELFPDPVSVANVATTCWSGVEYNVYMSNQQTSQTLSISIS